MNKYSRDSIKINFFIDLGNNQSKDTKKRVGVKKKGLGELVSR